MSPEEIPQREQRSQFPIAFAAGAVIVLLLLGGVILLSRGSHPNGAGAAAKLPFGPTEQAYAEHIHFKDIQMAKANNFLNQEFTYIAGTLWNDGARTIRALDVTLEFHDPFNQVILRENESLIGRERSRPTGRAATRLPNHPGTCSRRMESAVSFYPSDRPYPGRLTLTPNS